MNLSCYLGKPVQWDVALTRSGVPLALPDGSHVWFSAKRLVTDAGAALLLTEANGISFVSREGGRIRIRASAEQTAALAFAADFEAELQYQLPGEDPDIPDDGRGTLTALRSVTPSV